MTNLEVKKKEKKPKKSNESGIFRFFLIRIFKAYSSSKTKMLRS